MIECIFQVPAVCTSFGERSHLRLPAGSIVKDHAFLIGSQPLSMQITVLCPPPEPFEIAGMKIG
jgi:hypothetical protein